MDYTTLTPRYALVLVAIWLLVLAGKFYIIKRRRKVGSDTHMADNRLTNAIATVGPFEGTLYLCVATLIVGEGGYVVITIGHTTF